MFEHHIPALWRPRREREHVPSLYDLFDDLFESAGSGPGLAQRQGPWPGSISVDLVERDGEFLVRAELPGVEPKDVDLSLERGVLTIKAERHAEHEEKKDKYLHRERSFGSYTRSIRVPDSVKEDAVNATFDKGVLEVHLPKAEESKARRIAIS